MAAKWTASSHWRNRPAEHRWGMVSTVPTFHAYLVAVWDHWVVQVPDAGNVHAMVESVSDAEEVARQAIATVLGMDPLSIRVVIEPA